MGGERNKVFLKAMKKRRGRVRNKGVPQGDEEGRGRKGEGETHTHSRRLPFVSTLYADQG
jgi:hypothetical protein